MRQSISIIRSGFFRKLVLIKDAIPKPQKNEVLINVSFVGINFADVVMWRGFYGPAPKPPFVPGFEVSGIVGAIGENVKNIKVGERVFAFTRFGGYTSHLIVPENQVRVLSKIVELPEAAGFPATYGTAWIALKNVARVKNGETILIHAVAGGLGIALVQISKYLGLNVIGAASTDEKIEFAKKQGLDFGINYIKNDFLNIVLQQTNNRGVDICIDSVGGALLEKSFNSLAVSGRLIVVGVADLWSNNIWGWIKAVWRILTMHRFNIFELIENNRSVMGLQLLNLWDADEKLLNIFEDAITLFNSGVLRPQIDRIFPFDKVEDALHYIEDRKTKGKVLLRIGD